MAIEGHLQCQRPAEEILTSSLTSPWLWPTWQPSPERPSNLTPWKKKASGMSLEHQRGDQVILMILLFVGHLFQFLPYMVLERWSLSTCCSASHHHARKGRQWNSARDVQPSDISANRFVCCVPLLASVVSLAFSQRRSTPTFCAFQLGFGGFRM